MTTLYQVANVYVVCAGHVLIGDNEGLYLLDITGDNLFKFGDRDVRKVSQIRVMQEDNLVALLAGKGENGCDYPCCEEVFELSLSPSLSLSGSKRPSLRLFPTTALLNGEMKNAVIKVNETEGNKHALQFRIYTYTYVCWYVHSI